MNSNATSDRQREALAHLLERNRLWDRRLMPESSALLGRLWGAVDNMDAELLLAHVMKGPPGVDDEDRERTIASRLYAMSRTERRPLPTHAAELLARVLERLAPVRGYHDDAEPSHRLMRAPRAEIAARDLSVMDAEAIVDALVSNPRPERLSDTWPEFVAKTPEKGVEVLRVLLARGERSISAWHDTLYGLGRSEDSEGPFREVAEILLEVADDLLREGNVAWAVGLWLARRAKTLPPGDDELFLRLWDRLSPVIFERDVGVVHDDPDPLTAAFNDPPGQLTEALLHRYFATDRAEGGGLPPEMQLRFEWIAASTGRSGRIARTTLFRYLGPIFWNDPDWARRVMIPRLSWDDPPEAAALWRSFLSAGRIDADLFAAIKAHFLSTLREHAAEVPASEDMLFQFFMVAALELPGSIETVEAREILTAAGQSGRRSAALWLERVMPSKAGKGEKAWSKRYGPWLRQAWPKDRDLRDERTSRSLAVAAVESGDAFPDAWELVRPLLLPSAQGAAYVIHRLSQKDLAKRHPVQVLDLVDFMTSAEFPAWSAPELRTVLDAIAEADPAVPTDGRFRQLDERVRRILS